VEPLTDDPSRLHDGLEVYAGTAVRRIEHVRHTPRDVAVKFAGVDDRDGAELLRGKYLEVDADDVSPLPDGRFYHWQIVGLEVRRRTGELVGRVVDVQEYPANDVWVVDRGDSELLIPALKDFVVEVDVEAGRIIVDLPLEEEVR
jgi:16S rRNA processing protein RimM